MIGDLRSRYGADVPVLLGQMGPEEMERSSKDYSAINAVHADTPTRVPRTAFIEGPRAAYNSGPICHYSAEGQRALGRAMWSAYRAMLSMS